MGSETTRSSETLNQSLKISEPEGPQLEDGDPTAYLAELL